MIRRRIGVGAIVFILGLAVSLQAGENILIRPTQIPAAGKILTFPADQCVGNLYLEPESGPGWDPEQVGLSGQWEYVSAAQGDVVTPEDRNVKLSVRLALSPRESTRWRAQNPHAHQQTTADRTREDPDDLSGLTELEPNDLFWLSVGTEMYRRTGVPPVVFEPISRLTGLRILTLECTGVTDKGLECLRPLHSLRGLELTQFPIRSRSLAVLKDLPALEYLSLNTGITDAGLKQVAQMSNLRWLRISDGRMWGPGLAELAKLPRLERLCIQHSRGQISDKHIKYLEGLTQLKSLTLWSSGFSTLADASLASIGKLSNLEELHFIRTSPRFSPKGIAQLGRLKHLKQVDFAQIWSGPAGVQYGDEIVRQLVAALPHIESVKGLSYLSDESMKTLGTFRNLKCLHVGLKDRRQGYYGPTGVSHLANLGSLEELSIGSGDGLSEDDLASLAPLGRLKNILIMGPVTERGLASIGKLKQLEEIDLFLDTVNPSGLNYLNGLANLQVLHVVGGPRGPAAETDTIDELTLDLSGLKSMKDMNLSGLPLQGSDLAFLRHLRSLETLAIQPDSPLTGGFLRYLRELPELNRLHVSGLSSCTGADLAHLNGLPKLRDLRLAGNITDTALASLKGAASLWSLRVETDNPIRRETVTDLEKSHPVIEYIHIEEPWKPPTRPPQLQQRRTDSRSRSKQGTPMKRRGKRR